MKKNRKNKSILFRIFLLCFCAYFISSLATLSMDLAEGKKELKALKLEQQAQEDDIEELRAILQSDSDDEIIEKAARERLGYIYSDEKVFIDISGN